MRDPSTPCPNGTQAAPSGLAGLHPDPIAVLDAEGALVWANPAFRAAFRHTIGPGRPPWGRTQRAPVDGPQQRFEARSPDGRLFHWSVSAMPDGHSLVTAHDITAQAEAAASAAQARTSLFATLTHELRTPLNGILGMAELLNQTRLDPAEREFLAAISTSGEHLLGLITEILDYARLEAGQTAIEAHPFDPEATAQSVCELLSPRAHAKGLALGLVTDPKVPGLVSGDDGRLRQILFNLAGNAVKFTETGGVSIEITVSGADRLRFTVRDTGPGIAAHRQAAVFEEFVHADAEDGRRHGGAGLGLAIVNRLAKAMGGVAGLDSKLGLGSAFYVELPLPALAPPHWTDQALAGRKVLVISPAGVLGRVVRRTLQGLGAQVTVRTGLDQMPPVEGDTLVLLDQVACPDVHTASATPALANCPGQVVIIAPQEARAALERFRAAGFPRFLIAPLRRRSLIERICPAADVATRRTGPIDLGSEDGDDRLGVPMLSGLSVLLAEDNPVNALLAKTLLTRAGCRVDVVTDGLEAVSQIQAQTYDVALFDVRMPRLDGLGATQRVRALGGRYATLPILALTADAGEEDRKLALAAGFSAFLTKPIDPASLAQLITSFTKRATPPKLAAVLSSCSSDGPPL